MPIVFPHIFKDGPGNLASGVQVMENLEAVAAAIEGFTAAQSQTDLFQPGIVVNTDWVIDASINPATAGLGSEEATGGSAWTFNETGGLVRTFTPTAKLEGLVPPVKPANGKYLTVGFELKASGEGAVVTVVSGVEQATQLAAEEHSPAVSANKIRLRDVVVKNTAGVYSIVSETDRRVQATGRASLPFTFRVGSGVLRSGEYIQVKEGTQTLPAPTNNAICGVYCYGPTTAVVKTNGGLILGDFISGLASITLTQNQHVILQADGTNWWIVAGESRNENKYGAKNFTKAEAEAGVEPSANRSTHVNVVVTGTISTGLEFGISAGGRSAGFISISKVTGFTPSMTLGCKVNAGEKWALEAGSTGVAIVSSATRLD